MNSKKTASNDYRREETREKIIQAAKGLFSKKGYHNTQVMDIVKKAGISAGTFYNYFDDKRILFEQITKANTETLRLTLKRLRQPLDPGDIAGRLETIQKTYNAFFDYVDENPQQLLMILRGGFGIDEDLDDTVWNFFSSFAYDLAEDFQKWITLGLLEKFNTVLMGHIIMGMCLNTAHSYLVEKNFTREEAINTLIKLNKAVLVIYLTKKAQRTFKDLGIIFLQ